jgi:hypothetical protein
VTDGVDSPWGAPRSAEVHPAIRRLTAAFADVVHTHFVAPEKPAGAWVPYYEQFPFALQPPEAPLIRLTTTDAVLAGR